MESIPGCDYLCIISNYDIRNCKINHCYFMGPPGQNKMRIGPGDTGAQAHSIGYSATEVEKVHGIASRSNKATTYRK